MSREIKKAALAQQLEMDELEARVAKALGDPLYWFPVRHHSPMVAHHVRAVLLARRPKLVLIEGPSEATDQVKFVVDVRTKPPVAIYASYRDDTNVLGLAGKVTPSPEIPARFSVWYPLLPYSPEYVAMKTAKEIGAEVVFIDLPHHALISPEKEGLDRAPPTWESLLLENRFYATLAEVAGYRGWNEAWDALFEAGGRHADAESFRRDMALFCAAVRATTSHERMESDGTLPRERFMARAIKATLSEKKLKPEQAVVVTGGFHLFLDRDDPKPPPTPPAGTVYTTVAPYSYFRMSEVSGYGAGNRAPRYYERLWDQLSANLPEPPAAALVEHVVAVLSRGRKEGEGLSSADAISISGHARMLAALRGRRFPLLDDARDAIVTCTVKGRLEDEGAHVARAMSEVEVGNAVGRVTPAIGGLPIVHDFYAHMDELELQDALQKEKRLALALDLREEQGKRRSAFFHRLAHLGVPLAKQQEAVQGGGTLFKEKWSLQWSPKIEDALIEKNLYGDTVEAAAVALLEEDLAKDQQHAGRTCERLLKSVGMDLPGLVVRLESSCGAAINADRRFTSLAQALTHLLLLDRHAAYQQLRRDVIQDLVRRSFGRACFVIPEVASVPEEEQPQVVSALFSLAEALLGERGAELDRDLYVENVKTAARESPVPFLRGALLGVLAEIRALTPDELAAHVSAYARARPEELVKAGDFLDGVLAVSRTSIFLGADELVAAVDELLQAAAWDAFVTMLPRTRHAFERLHARQRDSLCERVARRYGLGAEAAEQIATLTTSVGAAAQIAALDKKVAEIMKEWTF
jgi:hypothetical protein